MFDLGWSELLVIGIAALIVVGPKDLPRMLRTLGQYVAKARGVAREFQRALDDAAREADIAELHEVKKTLDEARSMPYEAQRELGQSFLDADRSIRKELGTEAPADGAADGGVPGRAPGAAAKPKPAGSARQDDPAPSRATATPPLGGPGSGSGASQPRGGAADAPGRENLSPAEAAPADRAPPESAAGSKAGGA